MINCRAGGQPSPQIRWRKLTLASPITSSAGFVSSSTMVLQAQVPLKQPAAPILGLNGDLELSPKHTDFRIITSNSHIQILENGSMIIKEVEQSDATRYVCQAFNGINPTLSEMIELKVNSKL